MRKSLHCRWINSNNDWVVCVYVFFSARVYFVGSFKSCVLASDGNETYFIINGNALAFVHSTLSLIFFCTSTQFLCKLCLLLHVSSSLFSFFLSCHSSFIFLQLIPCNIIHLNSGSSALTGSDCNQDKIKMLYRSYCLHFNYTFQWKIVKWIFATK